jgi:hypothetical protein
MVQDHGVRPYFVVSVTARNTYDNNINIGYVIRMLSVFVTGNVT